MVFRVTEDGIIKADTLCEFTKKPQGASRLVGQKHQVREDTDECTVYNIYMLYTYMLYILTVCKK